MTRMFTVKSMKLRALGALCLLLAASTYSFSDDDVSRARALAYSGREHRAEALALLEQRLQTSPNDGDALTLYGTILSWDGRYDESRAALQKVLDKNPDHSDALPAMINLELWSDHPARAQQLAEASLQRHPNNPVMLMFLARAERNQNHEKEAAATLDELLKLDPSNQQALEMRRRMIYQAKKWEAEYSYNYTFFSSIFQPQQESVLSMRGPTALGSLIGSVYRADRFGEHSYQVEAEFYPHIRPGTYLDIVAGGSPDSVLYPEYHVSGDVYHSLGHGFEGSAGYHRLQFGDDVNIFTTALYKYHGSWLYSGRLYLTPGDRGSVGKTGTFAARYLFGEEGVHDYLEFGFSYGASKALFQSTQDLVSVTSSRYYIDYDKRIGIFHAEGKLGAGSEDEVFGGKVNRYTAQGSLYYRF